MIHKINKLSILIFLYLSRIYGKKLRMSEVGITDFLFNHIILTNSSKNQLKIFKLKSHLESVYGNDLDLFIKVGNNRYKWFVFQAKVMEYTGAFKDLKQKDKTSLPQWNKLKIHELLFDSEPYYLLYTGQPNISTKKIKGKIKNSDCLGQANYRQLGLSVIELNDVIHNRKTKNTSQLTYFNEFYPDKVKAFRCFFCPKGLDMQANRYYKLEEIINNNYYNEVNYERVKEVVNPDNFDELILNTGEGRTRIILEIAKE